MELISEDYAFTFQKPDDQEDDVLIFRKKRILLIEEDWDLSQLMQYQFHRDLGVDVERVQNIYQALGKMTHDTFDALVLDCRLNAYQALTEAEKFFTVILEEEEIQVQKIPVVVLTNDLIPEMEGLESQFFRISAQVQKHAKFTNTLVLIENELNEILDI